MYTYLAHGTQNAAVVNAVTKRRHKAICQQAGIHVGGLCDKCHWQKNFPQFLNISSACITCCVQSRNAFKWDQWGSPRVYINFVKNCDKGQTCTCISCTLCVKKNWGINCNRISNNAQLVGWSIIDCVTRLVYSHFTSPNPTTTTRSLLDNYAILTQLLCSHFTIDKALLLPPDSSLIIS